MYHLGDKATMSETLMRLTSLLMPNDLLLQLDEIARIAAVERGRAVSRADIIREFSATGAAAFFARERATDAPNGRQEAA